MLSLSHITWAGSRVSSTPEPCRLWESKQKGSLAPQGAAPFPGRRKSSSVGAGAGGAPLPTSFPPGPGLWQPPLGAP